MINTYINAGQKDGYFFVGNIHNMVFQKWSRKFRIQIQINPIDEKSSFTIKICLLVGHKPEVFIFDFQFTLILYNVIQCI